MREKAAFRKHRCEQAAAHRGSLDAEYAADIQYLHQLVQGGAILHCPLQQAGGLKEVYRVVAHMDETTQQNGTLVEQTTASARAMAVQAEQLRTR